MMILSFLIGYYCSNNYVVLYSYLQWLSKKNAED